MLASNADLWYNKDAERSNHSTLAYCTLKETVKPYRACPLEKTPGTARRLSLFIIQDKIHLLCAGKESNTMSDNYLVRSLQIAKDRSQYDANAKRLLSDKQVLARILKYTTTEFQEMDIHDIERCIEPSSVVIAPGYQGDAIEGSSQESAGESEGTIRYDIRFVAVAPNRDKAGVRIIIDVEAQKTSTPGYDLVTRGLFYGSRMLSEQLGKTFSTSDYDSLNKVYSIWIVMNCPQRTANTISRYSIQHTALYGNIVDTARSDLLTVIMIRLPGDDQNATQAPSELHKVLSVLLSQQMSAEEKLKVLGTEHGFDIDANFAKEVGSMCNLGDGIYEQGIEQGIKQGSQLGSQQTGALYLALRDAGRLDEFEKSIQDDELREKLLRELKII